MRPTPSSAAPSSLTTTPSVTSRPGDTRRHGRSAPQLSGLVKRRGGLGPRAKVRTAAARRPPRRSPVSGQTPLRSSGAAGAVYRASSAAKAPPLSRPQPAVDGADREPSHSTPRRVGYRWDGSDRRRADLRGNQHAAPWTAPT